LSSSAGDVGTLAMVSFRPSVDPMPMDASDRTDTASADQDGSGDGILCSERRLGDVAGDSGRRYEPFRDAGRRPRPCPVQPSLLSLPLRLIAVAVVLLPVSGAVDVKKQSALPECRSVYRGYEPSSDTPAVDKSGARENIRPVGGRGTGRLSSIR